MSGDSTSPEIPQYQYPFPDNYLVSSLTTHKDSLLVSLAQDGEKIADDADDKKDIEVGRDQIYNKVIALLRGEQDRKMDLVSALVANYIYVSDRNAIKSEHGKTRLAIMTREESMELKKRAASDYNTFMESVTRMG